MYEPRIAIIIPTIYNDNILMNTIYSILDNIDLNICKIFIIDQNRIKDYSEEKKIFYATAASDAHDWNDKKIQIIPLGYDCGDSYAYNEGIKHAERQNITYCLLMTDNIIFTKKMKNINKLLTYLYRYDILGLHIKHIKSKVGNLSLINKQFKYEPIQVDNCKFCDQNKIIIFNCKICDMFFITRTNILTKQKFDNRLKILLLEDYFIRLSWNDYKIGYTKYCSGEYIKSDNKLYLQLKKENEKLSKIFLNNKYKIKDS